MSNLSALAAALQAQLVHDDEPSDDKLPWPKKSVTHAWQNTGPVMDITIIMYGSKKGETVSDDRFGDHQRRVEIKLSPRLPRPGMTSQEISRWANDLFSLCYPTFKHSQKWHCEFCGTFTLLFPVGQLSGDIVDKPARMSETQVDQSAQCCIQPVLTSVSSSCPGHTSHLLR